MRAGVLITILSSIAPFLAFAQKPQIGLTLGVTTPGPMRWLDRRIIERYPDPTATNSALASPLFGVDAVFTLWKHLAIDVALRGSETGYKHEHARVTGAGTGYIYQERMQLRSVSLPLTLGYAFRLGRVKIRASAGYAFTYFVSGLYQNETRFDHHLNGSTSQFSTIDMFDDNDNFTVGARSSWKKYPRYQAQFRMSVNMQPAPKWRLGLAVNSGHNMNIYSAEPHTSGTKNYVYFSSGSYELAASYFLFKRDNSFWLQWRRSPHGTIFSSDIVHEKLCHMVTKQQSLLGGLVGSVVVNLLAEGIRKNFRTTPRLDRYGKQGLDRITEAVGIGRLPEGPRYWTALAGDLAMNTLVFALAGAGSKKRTLPQGLALGAAMAGAMMLAAKPAGIDPETTGENKKEKGMTAAYYLLGGLAAAGLIRWMESRS